MLRLNVSYCPRMHQRQWVAQIIGIEAHYLFHCVPIRGMDHHRTSVEEGLELHCRLGASGL
uniref:hypothetical protein n=1 Tax=Streptomyces aureocirculatus TaxID=67275 RepID=UPI00055BC9AC